MLAVLHNGSIVRVHPQQQLVSTSCVAGHINRCSFSKQHDAVILVHVLALIWSGTLHRWSTVRVSKTVAALTVRDIPLFVQVQQIIFRKECHLGYKWSLSVACGGRGTDHESTS